MPRRDTENGAVAVLVAILCLVLFGFAALAVDLGNAFTRTRDVQRQADFAALAGAAKLGNTHSGSVPGAAIEAVRDQLNGPAGLNLPQDDKGKTAVQLSDLTDANMTNGDVRFVNGALRVLAPQVKVAYSFGGLLGIQSKNVGARATAGAYSPGLGVMPTYAWKGCDWGPQYILDDSTMIAAPIPPLASPTDDADAKVEGLTYVEATHTLTIDGDKLSTVTSVGFFRTGSPPPAPITQAPTSTSTHSLTVQVPPSVYSTEDVWWVRVFKDGEWSPVVHGEIQAFPTGDTAPECDSESSDGNYGTLNIPRPSGDVTGMNEIIAKNMATSLEISLDIFPTGLPKCDFLPLPYTHVPANPSNCVPVKTGLPNPATTLGLIDGVDGVPGRLDHTRGDTNGSCGGAGANATMRGKTINNDYLTCFFTNDTVTIGDISRGSYAGPAVLSPDIFKSPRFVWLPIVKVEPDTGSGEYTLLDVRPAFLTDQPAEATRVNNLKGSATTNGLVAAPSGLRAVKAVIFNIAALPKAPDGSPVTPYIGVGDPVIRLIE